MRSRSLLLYAVCCGVLSAQVPKKPAAGEADEWLRKGIAAQQHGDAKTAIDDYRRALALNPSLPEARANLGAALAAAGDFDGAIEEDTRALENAPDAAAVRMNLGLAYYKKGDCGHARSEFTAVHQVRPKELSAAMLLGYCDLKLERPGEAVDLLLPMESGNASNMDLEYVLGYALILSGREAEGLPRLEKMAQATQSVDAWVIAGSTRLRRREFREAKTDLDAALQLHAHVPGLYTMAGQAHDAQGDTDGALPLFEAALREDPRDFMANLYLGTMRLKQRDFDSARPMLELALQLQPNMPQARLQMAKLNAMTGKYAEAAATLEDLERADPNWLDPHVELAALYYKLHKPEDGQRERDLVQQLEEKQQKAGPRPQ